MTENKAQLVTLCKFQPGFGGKFIYFITLKYFVFKWKIKVRIRAENLHLPVAGIFPVFKTLQMNKLIFPFFLVS